MKNNFIVSKEDDDEDDNSIIDPMDMLDSLLEETGMKVLDQDVMVIQACK